MPNASNLSGSERNATNYMIIDLLYVSFGSISATSNGIIIVAFLLNGVLRKRKELLLLVALAVADLTYCLGLVLTGIRRLYIAQSQLNIMNARMHEIRRRFNRSIWNPSRPINDTVC